MKDLSHLNGAFQAFPKPLQPVIICDKNFLQSLKPDEAELLEQYFVHNLTPIIFDEIRGNLFKNGGTAESPNYQEAWKTANKLPSNRYWLQEDYLTLAKKELSANAKPYPINFENNILCLKENSHIRAIAPDIIAFTDSPHEAMITNWKEKKFSNWDVERGKEYLNFRESFSSLTYQLWTQKIFKDQFNFVPTFTSIQEAVVFADEYIAQVIFANPKFLQGFFFNFLKLSKDEKNRVRRIFDKNLKNFGTDVFFKAYPHCFDCLKKLFCFDFLISRSQLPLRKSAKIHIDFQYLYYGKFCNVFVTSDHDLFKIFPRFFMNNQLTMWGEELKRILREF